MNSLRRDHAENMLAKQSQKQQLFKEVMLEKRLQSQQRVDEMVLAKKAEVTYKQRHAKQYYAKTYND